MTRLPDLTTLSRDELEALTRRLFAQVQELTGRGAALEAQHGRPNKTPDNSSLPQAPKADKPAPAVKRKSRPGVTRALAEHPDRIVEVRAQACPHCQGSLTEQDQTLTDVYDHIEIPPVTPDIPPVTPDIPRVHRHGGTWPHCRRLFVAPVPDGLDPGSPFGPTIAALAL